MKNEVNILTKWRERDNGAISLTNQTITLYMDLYPFGRDCFCCIDPS